MLFTGCSHLTHGEANPRFPLFSCPSSGAPRRAITQMQPEKQKRMERFNASEEKSPDSHGRHHYEHHENNDS